MSKANKAQVQVKGTPEISLQDLLKDINPSKMSRDELVAFATKASEIEKTLNRTRELERLDVLDTCMIAFQSRKDILGLEKGNLDHISHVVKGLTTGGTFVEYPRRDTLPKFFDKALPGLVSGIESFDFTHYIKVGEKEYMVRIRPKAERTKKTDKADKAEKAMKAIS